MRIIVDRLTNVGWVSSSQVSWGGGLLTWSTTGCRAKKRLVMGPPGLIADHRAAVAGSFRDGMLCACTVGSGGAAVKGEAAVPHMSCTEVYQLQ